MSEAYETIYAWPDGTWCSQDEIEDYNFMSDDYQVLSVPADFDAEDIDAYVDRVVGGKK